MTCQLGSKATREQMLSLLVHTRWRVIGSHPLQSVRTVQGERIDRNHHLARPGLGNRYLRDLQHLGPSIPSPCHRLHPRLALRKVTQMPCDAQPSKASCYAATPAHLGMGIARPIAPASRLCTEASPGTRLGCHARRSPLNAALYPPPHPPTRSQLPNAPTVALASAGGGAPRSRRARSRAAAGRRWSRWRRGAAAGRASGWRDGGRCEIGHRDRLD